MILKIADNESGWYYYDDVSRVCTKKYNLEEKEKTEAGRYRFKLIENPHLNLTQYLSLDFIYGLNKDKEVVWIITNAQAYLLNNEGKTIERIN